MTQFGNKMLIIHSVSYEVCRFLTSVVTDHVSKNHGIYNPHGSTSVQDYEIVDAVIDSFDQIEETWEDNSTTHSMTAHLYRKGLSTVEDDSYIPKLPKRSLNTVDTYDPEDDVFQR